MRLPRFRRSHPYNEVRLDGSGDVDDIAITGTDCFRMERMDRGAWWIAVHKGDKRICFWLSSRGNIRAAITENGIGTRIVPLEVQREAKG